VEFPDPATLALTDSGFPHRSAVGAELCTLLAPPLEGRPRQTVICPGRLPVLRLGQGPSMPDIRDADRAPSPAKERHPSRLRVLERSRGCLALTL
jgi:hypothetical protein